MKALLKGLLIGMMIINSSCVIKNSYIPYYERKDDIIYDARIDAKSIISIQVLKYTPKDSYNREFWLSEQEFKNEILDDFSGLFTNDQNAKNIYVDMSIGTYDHALTQGGYLIRTPAFLLSLVGLPFYIDNIIADVQINIRTDDTLLYNFKTSKKEAFATSIYYHHMMGKTNSQRPKYKEDFSKPINSVLTELRQNILQKKDSIEYHLYESMLDLDKITSQIENYVNEEINKWQVQGRFENSTDFQKRITPLNRQHKIDDIVKSRINTIATNEIKLGIKQTEFDPDNEVFKVTFRSLPLIFIKVPITNNEASSFENNISSLSFSNADFALTKQGFALLSLTINNPSNNKTYRYHYQDNLAFKKQKVEDEYEPLKISIRDYIANAVIQKNLNMEGEEVINTPVLDQKGSQQKVVPISTTETKLINPKGDNLQLNQPKKRIALVIGNGNYTSSILANPENDARSMTDILRRLGFVVYPYENLNASQMKRAIDDFGVKLKGNDVGLFYYAGHGIQAKGYNYLIPVDAILQSEQEVEYECVQADRILGKMEGSDTKVNIIILDACRNNPFERSWTRSTTGKGLAFMDAPRGTLIAYATAPGSTASDGSGENSPYTTALLESIMIPNITVIQMFQNIGRILYEKSGKQQVPWIASSLISDFYFTTSEINVSNKQQNISDTAPVETKPSNESDYIIDSRDEQRYKTVNIGKQVWLAENLRTTKYSDGTVIPIVVDNEAWGNLRTPACCWYQNDYNAYGAYGALYNWYTINTYKLCPTGWHIPTDSEWVILTTYLGGENVAGSKLKESGSDHWEVNNDNATNETGFTALPAGFRMGGNNFEKFNGIYQVSTWWSATDSSTSLAWSRLIRPVQSALVREAHHKYYGFSVRCIKD